MVGDRLLADDEQAAERQRHRDQDGGATLDVLLLPRTLAQVALAQRNLVTAAGWSGRGAGAAG